MSSVRDLLQAMPPLFAAEDRTASQAAGSAETQEPAPAAVERSDTHPDRPFSIKDMLSAAVEKLTPPPPEPDGAPRKELRDVLRELDLAISDEHARRLAALGEAAGAAPEVVVAAETVPVPELTPEPAEDPPGTTAETVPAAPVPALPVVAPRPVSRIGSVVPPMLDALTVQLRTNRERLAQLEREIAQLDESITQSKRHLNELTRVLKSRNARRNQLIAIRRAQWRFLNAFAHVSSTGAQS